MCQGGCRVLFHAGYGCWYHGLTCAPCLAFLHTSLGPYLVGVPGRLIPVSSDRASRRRAVSRGRAYPGQRVRGRSQKRCFWLGLSVEEAVWRQAGNRIECSGWRGGRSWKTGVVPPRPDLPVDDWTTLLDCCFRYLGWRMSCALSTWAEPLWGSRSTRDHGFMNPTQMLTKESH